MGRPLPSVSVRICDSEVAIDILGTVVSFPIFMFVLF